MDLVSICSASMKKSARLPLECGESARRKTASNFDVNNRRQQNARYVNALFLFTTTDRVVLSGSQLKMLCESTIPKFLIDALGQWALTDDASGVLACEKPFKIGFCHSRRRFVSRSFGGEVVMTLTVV